MALLLQRFFGAVVLCCVSKDNFFQYQSQKIEVGASQFKTHAEDLKKKYWWENKKWWIGIGTAVLVLITVVVVILVVKFS